MTMSRKRHTRNIANAVPNMQRIEMQNRISNNGGFYLLGGQWHIQMFRSTLTAAPVDQKFRF